MFFVTTFLISSLLMTLENYIKFQFDVFMIKVCKSLEINQKTVKSGLVYS